MHPYWENSFFGFFATFFRRLFSWFPQMATDEVQLFTLFCIGISAALIGPFLIFRRMTMLANSLAHTILLGIVITYALLYVFGNRLDTTGIDMPALLIASLITGVLTTVTTQFFTTKLRLQEDASIGLVFTAFFALGILLVTLFTRNAHIGVEVITGNIDALHRDDLKLALWVLLGNLFLFALMFRKLAISSFDPSFAKTIGIPVAFLNYILMVQTSGAAIAAFRAVGVFLFLIFLVGPPLIARFYTKKLGQMTFFSVIISMLASFLGVALSRHCFSVYHMPLSTAGLVVAFIGIFYFAAKFHSVLRKKYGKKMYSMSDRAGSVPSHSSRVLLRPSGD